MGKYLITGCEWRFAPLSGQMLFDGFKLEGINGAVDPFVGGEFSGNAPDPSGATYAKEEWEWAKQQVGKYLECDEIIYRAFATRGPAAISESSGA